MRKIIVLEFITLDGIVQAPGGPEEDPSNGFKYGGWTAPFDDESAGKVFQKILAPADLLLGRHTFEIWETYWPKHTEIWPGIMEVTKYCLSATRTQSDWSNCTFITNVDDIKKLKNSEGGDIKVWGSSELVQLLLEHDLVDEFWFNIHPVVLGKGKRIFNDNSLPAAFKLAESHITNTGVIMANYQRNGEVKTGRMGG
ncbi:dihydrofolate reductase family protein [Mucilaginibacter sp. AW1-3]